MLTFRALLLAGALSSSAFRAQGQTPPAQPPAPQPQASASAGQAPKPVVSVPTVCGQAIPTPANLPPADSGPLVYLVVPCFQKQGGFSVIDPGTYVYYIQMHGSQPTPKIWVPYDDKAEKLILADFKRLMATNFLDDLSIDVQDYTFSNGVAGKLIVYDMEE